MKKIILISLINLFILTFIGCSTALEKACDNGDGVSCYEQAIRLEAYKLSKDARLHYAKGCALNNEKSCFNIQNFLLTQKEVNILEKACIKGNQNQQKSTEACFYLAEYYYTESKDKVNVENKKKIKEKARLYYTKGCALGDDKSCFRLSNYFSPLSQSEINNFKKACIQSNENDKMPLVCYQLGEYYYKTKDYKNALVYYKRSCDYGNDTRACREMADIYADGKNGEVNLDLAKKYYDIVCRRRMALYNEYSSSCEILENIDPQYYAQSRKRYKTHQQTLQAEKEAKNAERKAKLGISKECLSDADKIMGCSREFDEFVGDDYTRYGYIRSTFLSTITYKNGKVMRIESYNKSFKLIKSCNIIIDNNTEMVLNCWENGENYTMQVNPLTKQFTKSSLIK